MGEVGSKLWKVTHFLLKLHTSEPLLILNHKIEYVIKVPRESDLPRQLCGYHNIRKTKSTKPAQIRWVVVTIFKEYRDLQNHHPETQRARECV